MCFRTDGCFIDGATFPHTLSGFQKFEKWNISDAKASAYIPAHDQALWTLNTALGEGSMIANGGKIKTPLSFSLHSQVGNSSVTNADASTKTGSGQTQRKTHPIK